MHLLWSVFDLDSWLIRIRVRASSKVPNIFFLIKIWSFTTLKKALNGIKKSSPRVSNNPLLKYRRQFYIRNRILFLNYPNHFYIFFLSCTFAAGTLSYSLFFLCPSTFRLVDKHTREKICATPKHVTLRETGWLFSSSKRLGRWIRSR
jgi:hypothetical protein